MADHLDKESLQSIRDCFDRLVTFTECIDRILGSYERDFPCEWKYPGSTKNCPVCLV